MEDCAHGFPNGIDCPECATNTHVNLTLEITCENPECPRAGRCGGECARNF